MRAGMSTLVIMKQPIMTISRPIHEPMIGRPTIASTTPAARISTRFLKLLMPYCVLHMRRIVS